MALLMLRRLVLIAVFCPTVFDRRCQAGTLHHVVDVPFSLTKNSLSRKERSPAKCTTMKRKLNADNVPEAAHADELTEATSGFQRLSLDARLLQGIREEGFANPTPVQSKAIPLAIQGTSVLGKSQTVTKPSDSNDVQYVPRQAPAKLQHTSCPFSSPSSSAEQTIPSNHARPLLYWCQHASLPVRSPKQSSLFLNSARKMFEPKTSHGRKMTAYNEHDWQALQTLWSRRQGGRFKF